MQAIMELPEPYREVIILVNFDGLTYDETGTALGISPGTVRSRMNRGRTLLQKVLWQHAKDIGLIEHNAAGDKADER